MRELQSLVGEAVELAHARGAECEVWLERRTATELRATSGDLHHVAERATLTGTVTTWRRGREGCAVSQGAGGIAAAVDAALALGEVLPRRERLVRAFAEPTGNLGVSENGSARPADGDLARLGILSGRSDLVRDVILDAHEATTAFGVSAGVYRERRSSRSVVQARFANRTGNGALTRSFVGREPAGTLRLAEDAVDECLWHTTALGEPVAAWKPPTSVLLHGSVLSRLLSLLAPSLQLDSVAQRKSRLADRLGEQIAAPGFRLVDDAPGSLSPVAYWFDDEGTTTRVLEVIADGRLCEFLSDARHAADHATTSTGAGWRSASGGEVRVRPGALIAGWSDLPVPIQTGTELRVLQATGMHISNDVTGDFSFGAVGVLDDGSGRLRNAGNFTVAGNVIEMLKCLRPVESPVRHVARSVGLYGSPDIGVSGLVIGR